MRLLLLGKTTESPPIGEGIEDGLDAVFTFRLFAVESGYPWCLGVLVTSSWSVFVL